MADDSTPRIAVRDLTMAFGSFVVMRDLSFEIRRGSVFFIMGGSAGGARDAAPARRRALPERRAVELDDAGREHRAAAR
jgi:ABC-type phosphonate transport system ATPase subunit